MVAILKKPLASLLAGVRFTLRMQFGGGESSRKFSMANGQTWRYDRNDRNRFDDQPRVSYVWPDVFHSLEKFTFFWRAESPFSQHYPVEFKLEGKTFNCSEQYYMYRKAAKFGSDMDVKRIMETRDPAKQKNIGKNLVNFNEEEWDSMSSMVVREGNIAKFGQNERLLNLLVATRGTKLVEASPYDRKWGIGLEAHDGRSLRQSTWRGENRLGSILTEVRDNKFSQTEYKVDSSPFDGWTGYTTFWRSSSPFSPRYISPFSVEDKPFLSLHHYLMYKSADMFRNFKTASFIANSMHQDKITSLAYNENPSFNQTAWESDLTKNLVIGNFYKFTQNENLKALLLASRGTVLVFSGSEEKHLGNGVRQEEDGYFQQTSATWKDDNLLGFVLTHMRNRWIEKSVTLEEFLSDNISGKNYDLKTIDDLNNTEPQSSSYRLNTGYEKESKDTKRVESNEKKIPVIPGLFIEPQKGENSQSQMKKKKKKRQTSNLDSFL